MSLPVLHEIATDYSNALEELTDLQDEAIVDTLEGLKGTLEQKSENIIKYTQNLQGTINAMKDAEKNIAERRKKLEKKCENIKEYVKGVMVGHEINKIETVHFSLTIKKNPPKVVVDDYTLVPSQYFNQKITETFKRDKAKKDLQNGLGVEGARLEQGTRLDIK